MTLPDVLEALAVRLPERFRMKRYTRTYAAIQARLDPALPGCGWDDVYDVYDLAALNPAPLPEWRWRLREALEQECATRDWDLSLEVTKGQALATVWRGGDSPDCRHPATADTPAHALCLALLSALEAQ